MRFSKKSRRIPIWLESQAPLRQWYASGLGQSIAERLQSALNSRLGDVFGYQGLQIGNLIDTSDLLEGAGLQRRLILDAPGNRADIHADVLSLPIATGSMKAVLFFHTLDFCEAPHQALREADRVLTDDGQLIIVGFNPFSAFGVRHMLTAWRHREPWNGHFYSRRRVGEWLSVLDYRVLDSAALFIRPPINSAPVLRRLNRLERLQPWMGGIGGLYILRARKQTIPMTMSRAQWLKKGRGLAVGGYARSGDSVPQQQGASVARIDSHRSDKRSE